MAIVQDAVTPLTVSSSGVGSYTFTHVMGTVSNGLLLVCVEIDDGNHITGVTYNTVAMSQLGIVASTPGSAAGLYIYGLLNPASGSHSVVISRNTTVSTITGGAVSFSGVLQSGLPDAQNTNTKTTGTALSTSITTVADNAWIFGLFQNDNQGITAGTNSTVVNTGPNAGGPWSMFSYTGNPKTPAGAQSLTMNGTTGNGAMILVSFAPAAVVAPDLVDVEFPFVAQLVIH